MIFLVNYILLISQTIIPAGNVSGTWDFAGSPYLIYGEIEIPNGETLTINPGCLIEFQEHYKLKVQGRLLAIGTEQDSIRFTVADTTGFYNLATTDGGWRGFIFDQTPATNDSTRIVHAIIEFVKSLEYGAGSYVNNFDKLKISNSTFRNNYADQGGAFNLHNTSCVFMNNLFVNNKSRYGGALSLFQASAKIINNIIINNIATIHGGALNISGETNENALIVNNTICNNSSRLRGAVHLHDNVSLINNIVWYNQGYQISGAYNSNTLLNNNIENGLSSYPNYYDTNLDFNPFFMGENDYHLNPISSCINRGISDTTGLYLPVYDFDGNPRIFYGDSPRIDIGAYEYQGEPILFYPDYSFDGNFGAVPYTVQFTDLSEGEIGSWEWDFENDGIIDSYEQNPEFTYLDGGIFSVSLTICNGEYELTRTKHNIIETGNAYSYYQEKFSFSKINSNDELCSIQLFDFNGDGQKEIYTCYKNSIERDFRILGININGEAILNDVIQIDNEDENLEKISLLKFSNTGYIVIVSKITYELGGYPQVNNYDIIIRVYTLNDLTMITENSISYNNHTGCSVKKLAIFSNDESKIYVGSRLSYNEECGGSSYDKMIRCEFNGSALNNIILSNSIGTLIYPQSNLGASYYSWWDDLGGGESSVSFKALDNLLPFASSSNTSIYGLATRNDDLFENYGCVIYLDEYLKCYSPNLSTLLWQTQMPLPTGFCSSTITYNNNNHYLLLFDRTNETVNLIDRLNGEVVGSHDTSLSPSSIHKTASDELILFENFNDEYIVYTNDPNYYTGIESFEISGISQKYSLNNFPNPFNPSTTIEFSVQNDSDVEISIYNIKGQKIQTLIQHRLDSGDHSINWSGDNNKGNLVSSGVYFCKLKVNGKVEAVKKCLLLK